jgi:hypothetical protein
MSRVKRARPYCEEEEEEEGWGWVGGEGHTRRRINPSMTSMPQGPQPWGLHYSSPYWWVIVPSAMSSLNINALLMALISATSTLNYIGL